MNNYSIQLCWSMLDITRYDNRKDERLHDYSDRKFWCFLGEK